MHRFTKIVATLGPASTHADVLDALVAEGIDVIRLNFSHGSAQDHRLRAAAVREAAHKHQRVVGIMADLQGPKIRVGKFAGSKVLLKAGQRFTFDIHCELGDSQVCGLDYPELTEEVLPGDVLLLDDGRIVMTVDGTEAGQIHCRVRTGGLLSNNKGINKQGGGLSAPALTEKDREDIAIAAQIDVDYVAVSFPKSGADIHQARTLLREAGSSARLVAKIERVEAVAHLEEIILASDGVMVARGDLAVEVGDAAVPALQKRIILAAREANRFVITATQMMESMIQNPVPTRAEVSDVANAVLDGTDAVMLSAETAAGEFPVHTVSAMARICVEAEKSMNIAMDAHFLNRVFTRMDQAIAMSALFAAHHLRVRAIATLTDSGSTALWASRVHSTTPIYALTPNPSTLTQCSILRGVTPVLLHAAHQNPEAQLRAAQVALLKAHAVDPGDFIALTSGEPIGHPGGTNTLKLIRIDAPSDTPSPPNA
jgi:pyruvate kinase